MIFDDKDKPAYRVGGLLYTPALKKGVDIKILNNEIKDLTSAAFCLEDSIHDSALEAAEANLSEMLTNIYSSGRSDLPMLFIRIRSPEHMKHIHELLGETENVVAGYILPKFDLSNAERYLELAGEFNRNGGRKIYIMPILESNAVADPGTRLGTLLRLKEIMEPYKEYILNVRVGGNDLSNLYGLRRSVERNIYEIGVIRDILVNIISIFADTYIVSGPVWEYFGKNKSDCLWENGFRREIELDLLNGFIGKTCIHPSQLPVFRDCMRVRRADLEDAKKILNCGKNGMAVAKSADGSRMNEFKTHRKWAERIYILSEIYGVKDE